MALWTVFVGTQVVHKPVTTERNVTKAVLEIADNAAGSLELGVPATHPLYQQIAAMPVLGSPMWRVLKDGLEVFRGRTLSRKRSPLDATLHVVCEGDLAMLNDSIVEPYEFSGSLREYLEWLVARHNAQVEPWKQFVVGDVTAYDSNDYIVRASESRVTTWSEVSQKTFGSSTGGHVVLRRGTHVIDWLADVSAPCDQPVRLGYNLLGLEDESDGAELCTAIRAIGADVDGVRTELSPTRGAPGVTLANGILANDALVATNGTIVREVVWDDVTTEDVLWRRALAYVQALSLPRSVTVKAIDMSDAGHDVDAFDLGMVVSLDALDIKGSMQVSGIKWDMLDPTGGTITFGPVSVTMSARSASISSTADAAKYIAGNAQASQSTRVLAAGTVVKTCSGTDVEVLSAAEASGAIGHAPTVSNTLALVASGDPAAYSGAVNGYVGSDGSIRAGLGSSHSGLARLSYLLVGI